MKVAIYCRLSEEDRNKSTKEVDSESIQNQKSILLKYALDNGWEVYNIYSDDDFTGADRNRPAFNRLLTDAEDQKFDIVLCKTQSRFTRELEIVEKYIHHLFPLWGVRFVSVVDHADTSVKGNKKARQINGLINEWYLEDLSENIKSVFTSKRKNGLHIGPYAKYGYEKDPEHKGKLLVDPEAAQIVKEIFALYANGYGKLAICKKLNQRAIPTPSAYKRMKGINCNHAGNGQTFWRVKNITDILTDELYIGNLVQGRKQKISYKTKIQKSVPKEKWIRVENTHQPIIEKSTWHTVQELIKSKVKPEHTGKTNLFAYKVKCASCGKAMGINTNGSGVRNLRCSTRAFMKEHCEGAYIHEAKLKQAVLDELRAMIDEYLDEGEISANVKYASKIDEKIAGLEKQIKGYEKAIGNYKSSIKSLYMDKVKGLVNEQDYAVLSMEFSDDRDQNEELLRQAHTDIRLLNEEKEANANIAEKIKEYTNIKELKREHIETLIEKIYVAKKDENGFQSIKIIWKF